MRFKNLFFLLSSLMLLSVTGCTGIQVHSSINEHAFELKKGDLEQYGLAFLTPTTPTGQEEDKQGLAFGFADVLKKERNQLRFVTLPTTLGAVNKANLADAYKQMYQEYTTTGILKKEVLSQIGELVNARYFALLNLGQFSAGTNNRFGILGLRLVDTKYSNIRLFLQLWDAQQGSVAWEGMVELNYSDDTMSESPITFRTVVEESSKLLIKSIP